MEEVVRVRLLRRRHGAMVDEVVAAVGAVFGAIRPAASMAGRSQTTQDK